MVLEDDRVPDGVELLSFIMRLGNEVITSSVTSCVLFGVSVSDMEWLMYVTLEMDKKSKGN